MLNCQEKTPDRNYQSLQIKREDNENGNKSKHDFLTVEVDNNNILKYYRESECFTYLYLFHSQ